MGYCFNSSVICVSAVRNRWLNPLDSHSPLAHIRGVASLSCGLPGAGRPGMMSEGARGLGIEAEDRPFRREGRFPRPGRGEGGGRIEVERHDHVEDELIM